MSDIYKIVPEPLPVTRNNNRLRLEPIEPRSRCKVRPTTKEAEWLRDNRPFHVHLSWSFFNYCVGNDCETCRVARDYEMKQTKRTSVELLPGQLEAIQQIAFELGYVQSRGVGIGKVGSMAQLMQAIAKGELKVIKND